MLTHERRWLSRPVGLAAARGAAPFALLCALLCAILGPAPGAAASDAGVAEQGRYLAAAGDCISCHTRAGGAPFAGGLPLDTPFGVIYSANITPDAGTGIGAWTEAQFARALRDGIAPDGRHLYPAFPYPEYTKLTDADVHALFAYLKSLRPVRYVPPDNRMPFPFGLRALLAGWNLLFFQAGRYSPDTTRSAEWNRGAYLTQGLGHCGGCHTPRNLFGAERSGRMLAGAVYRDEIADEVVEGVITPMDERTVRNWAAANLTPAPDGLGAWSVPDIAAYLKSGHNARAAAFGPMSKVVMASTSRLTDADVHAIAVYLKSLPPAVHEAAAAPPERLRRGEIVYTTRCGDCHLPSGLGMPRTKEADPGKTAPPLAGNAALQAPDPATLINVILYGAHEDASSPGAWPRMSGFELSVGLDDAEIADLCTYVRSSWGNRAGAVDAAAVAGQR